MISETRTKPQSSSRLIHVSQNSKTRFHLSPRSLGCASTSLSMWNATHLEKPPSTRLHFPHCCAYREGPVTMPHGVSCNSQLPGDISMDRRPRAQRDANTLSELARVTGGRSGAAFFLSKRMCDAHANLQFLSLPRPSFLCPYSRTYAISPCGQRI